jgi:Flp pilus assembly protein TadG
MCATLFLLMAMIGVAFDFGRIYIARNEAQVFTDAAAMTAASKMDGTGGGLARARQAVQNLPVRWNFGTMAFSGVRVEFSADGRDWKEAPEKDEVSPQTLRMVRVTAPANDVDITFLRMSGGPEKLRVAARTVASANPVRLVE